MQERRLKRLGLLDDDGRSTYDGAQLSLLHLHSMSPTEQSSVCTRLTWVEHDEYGMSVFMLRSLRWVFCRLFQGWHSMSRAYTRAGNT